MHCVCTARVENWRSLSNLDHGVRCTVHGARVVIKKSVPLACISRCVLSESGDISKITVLSLGGEGVTRPPKDEHLFLVNFHQS